LFPYGHSVIAFTLPAQVCGEARDSLSPSPGTAAQRCTPEAEDNTWKMVRYLHGDPSPAKIHLSISFRQEETKRSPTPPQKLNGL